MADLEIIKVVWSLQEQKDLETIDLLVAEAFEELLKSPSNPSRYHYLSCLYISKKLPEIFGLPKTFQVMFAFLIRSMLHSSGVSTIVLCNFVCITEVIQYLY
jgi:hypothetical protein